MSRSSRALWVIVPLLWCAVLASAAGAIYCKYRARELFIELDGLNAQRNRLDADWGRLQLEQSAWSSYGYVERVASSRLHMHIPQASNVKILRP